MTDTDPFYLRPWLEEQENYARSIKPGDPRIAIAKEMLTIIAAAKAAFVPSADSTANFVPGKQIIEDLSLLRMKAEGMDKG